MRERIMDVWSHFTRYKPLMNELVVRDLKIKYRRSFLGYVWSLLNPLLMMCVMTLVFSNVFRGGISNFPLYLICGQTLFTFFNESTNMAMRSILDNGSLLRKVYVPKFIFPISRVLSSFVTMSFSLVAVLIVLLFSGIQLSFTMLLFFVPLVFLFVFCCGVGLILAAFSVYFRDVVHLYSVITLAWMYGTPIFYPIEGVSLQIAAIIKLNPLYHYINCFRNLVIYGNIPGPNTWFACIASSLLMLAIGLIVFNKLQKNFILYI
ncbi:MAG: ABC transporter permease [Candidatus Limiplasma sp.]|nr:ABC transporter permease [Candidatus Limiplasma sp.]